MPAPLSRRQNRSALGSVETEESLCSQNVRNKLDEQQRYRVTYVCGWLKLPVDLGLGISGH